MKKLLLIAGAVVSVNEKGQYCTKAPIRDYMHEISQYFDRCTWFVDLAENQGFSSVIDESRVNLVINKKRGHFKWLGWFRMAVLASRNDYVLYFLPNRYFLFLPSMLFSAKRIAVYLGVDYLVNLREFRAKRWPGWAFLMRLSYELPLRYGSLVLARGKHLASLSSRFNEAVYETVPMGHMYVDQASKGRECASDGVKRVLYLGKITQGKGVSILLDALIGLISRNPGVRFEADFLGEGTDLKRCRKQVADQGLANVIRFPGWVSSTKEIDCYFFKASLLVVPSIYPEGVPRVIDEAIVRDVPVISTAVGGIGQEYPNNEVLFVKEDDVDDLQQAMFSVLTDNELNQSLLIKSQLRKEFFTRNHSAAQQHAKLLLATKD